MHGSCIEMDDMRCVAARRSWDELYIDAHVQLLIYTTSIPQSKDEYKTESRAEHADVIDSRRRTHTR